MPDDRRLSLHMLAVLYIGERRVDFRGSPSAGPLLAANAGTGIDVVERTRARVEAASSPKASDGVLADRLLDELGLGNDRSHRRDRDAERERRIREAFANGAHLVAVARPQRFSPTKPPAPPTWKRMEDMRDEKKTVQIAVRLPESLVDRIDEWAGAFEAEHPGVDMGRAAAMRTLLERGLGAAAKPAPKKQSRR